MKEKAPGKSVAVILPERLWLKLRHRAIDEVSTTSAVVQRALDAYLARSTKAEPPKEGSV